MPDFSLVTVCTGPFPIEYVDKLVRRLHQVSNLNFRSYCITDRPFELPNGVHHIEPSLPVEGWWNKIQAYDPKTMPEGWIIYMDLDIVVVNSFDDTIRKILEQGDPHKIYCVSDAINWMDNKFSSSFMMLQAHNHRYIWNKFRKNYEKIVKQPGGDQVWVGKNMTPLVEYIDDADKNFKVNLKFHLGKKAGGQWKFPQAINPKIKMVDCGGRPKPHELAGLSYIRKNWTEI